MLTALSIRDVVLVERLDLSFARGLCALTGETGAGKSILLDALGLALGARAEAGLVRAGTERAAVTAGFDLPRHHPAFALLAEQGLPDEEMILRRVVTPDGRSRAFVNDEPISVGLLRQIGETLVEVQGQFDTRGLLDPVSHRPMLDAFGAHDAALGATGAAWRAWRNALDAWQRTRDDAAAARRDEEMLRAALEELDALDPRDGEEQELADLRITLGAREKIVEALNTATAELAGGGRSVDTVLRAAQRALERVVEQAGGLIDEPLAALERASIEIAEASAGIDAASSRIESDGGRLEEVEERLYALRGVARKHGVAADELPGLRTDMHKRLEALEGGDTALGRLEAQAAAARAAYAAAAVALTAARREAAARLDRAVAAELAPLKLGRAAFRTRLDAQPEEG
ncbi:MAG: AAA family ATPase, partial [Alphaproteobacteria bacterium]